MKIGITLFPLVVLMVFSGAHAQSLDAGTLNVPPVEKTGPKLLDRRDVLTLDFGGGREAGIFIERGPIKKLKVKLSLTENSCDIGAMDYQCDIQQDVTQVLKSLRWTKHPDPKRLGDIVVRQASKNQPEEKEYKEDTFADAFRERFNPTIKELEKGEVKLTCKKNSWILNAQKANGEIQFSSLGMEFNMENLETNASENLSLSEIYNLVFEQKDFENFSLVKVQNVDSLGIFSPFAPIGNLHFVSRDKNQKLCQAVFAVDSGLALALTQNDDTTYLPSTRRPLLFHTGSSYDFVYEIKQILRSSEGQSLNSEVYE